MLAAAPAGLKGPKSVAGAMVRRRPRFTISTGAAGRAKSAVRKFGGGGPARTAVFTEKTYHDAYDPIRAVRTKEFSYIENYAPRPELVLPLDIADELAKKDDENTADAE